MVDTDYMLNAVVTRLLARFNSLSGTWLIQTEMASQKTVTP